MARKFDPYNGGLSTEPNMRQELINTLDGSYPEISKKHTAVLRKMRRDDDGDLVSCPCVDETTKEPDKDRYCPFCLGEGYYFDETFIDVYRVTLRSDTGQALAERIASMGIINEPIVVFYLKYDVDITDVDKIVEIRLKTNGSVYTPYQRLKVFSIGSLESFRGDNGKLEYHKALCYGETTKYLNGDLA